MDLGMSREVQVSISMPSSNIQDAPNNRIHHQIYSTKAFGIVEGMCTPTPAIYHHANEVNRAQPHHVPEMTNVAPPPRSRDEIRPHHMPEMTNVTPPRPREEIRPHHVPDTVNAVPPRSRDEIRPHHMADTLNAVPPRSRDEIRPHTHQQQHNSSQTLHVQHFVVSQPTPPPPPPQQENNAHVTPTATRSNDKAVKYRECRKNHAASIGGYAVDGCGEFMPSGEEGTPGSLKCAACSCHRNFHRREVEGEVRCDCHHAMIRR